MTELEAQQALISLTREYMKHSQEERKELYNEYQEKRNKVKEALSKYVFEKKQVESNSEKIR